MQDADSPTVVRDEDQLPYRLLVGGKPADIEKMNRKDRRQIEAQLKQFDKRYRNVRGPNDERPAEAGRS